MAGGRALSSVALAFGSSGCGPPEGSVHVHVLLVCAVKGAVSCRRHPCSRKTSSPTTGPNDSATLSMSATSCGESMRPEAACCASRSACSTAAASSSGASTPPCPQLPRLLRRPPISSVAALAAGKLWKLCVWQLCGTWDSVATPTAGAWLSLRSSTTARSPRDCATGGDTTTCQGSMSSATSSAGREPLAQGMAGCRALSSVAIAFGSSGCEPPEGSVHVHVLLECAAAPALSSEL